MSSSSIEYLSLPVPATLNVNFTRARTDVADIRKLLRGQYSTLGRTACIFEQRLRSSRLRPLSRVPEDITNNIRPNA